jgi:phage major head subunit gpT-like protein
MTVLNGATFAAGLRTEFLKTYEQEYAGLGSLDVCMQRDIPSDKFLEKYVYYETSPYLRLWKRGQTMPMGAFRAVQYSVSNLEWAISIPWHYRDRNDDQTKSLVQHARQAGENAALLDERVFFQIMTAGSSALLLENVPTCPDGAALYATVDGASAARFGATYGNLWTGTGVSVPSTIITDICSVLSQFQKYQDTEGEPLLSANAIDGGITIFASHALRQVMLSAIHMLYQPYTTVTAGNVTVSNLFKDAGQSIKVVFSQRITGNSWYVFLNNCKLKPVFSQLREPLQDMVATWENSDITRANGIESIRWWEAKGYGCNLPYGTIKVYNS